MNGKTAAEPVDVFGETSLVLSTGHVDTCQPQGIEPLIRQRDEHNISRRDIDPDALKVLYRLSRNRYTAYLVGGGVRDLLLGRKPKDFDVSTNARPEEIRALFRNCILIGRRFRLAHIRYGEKIIETSTFRRNPDCAADPGDPEADLFQRDDNFFGTPEEDAVRRDFTVNGLFYDIESFSIIDYVGGMEDLEARRIRAIGDPNIRFREDPIRMIRAIRFASRLDFTIDAETLDAMIRHREEVAKAAPARLLEEICRLFAFSSGEKAVRLLHETGILSVVMPEVEECLDDGGTDHSVFWRRLQALDTGDTVLPDASPALIFATLLVDALRLHFGKEWNGDRFPRFKYERVEKFLRPLAERLRFPKKLTERIVQMYMAQSRFDSAGRKKDSIKNFVTKNYFHEALALAEILAAANGKPQTELNQWRDLLAERIYGRDDNEHRPGGRHTPGRQAKPVSGSALTPAANAAGETPAAPVMVVDGEAPRRLSRSARRRLNKRMKKLQDQELNQTGSGAGTAQAGTAPQSVEDEGPGGAAKGDRTGDAGGVVVTENGDGAVQPASGENETPVKGNARRGRRSGGRSRRGRQPQVQTETAGPSTTAPDANPAGNEQTVVENFQPLTAAAFYRMPEPEPEVEPEPEPAKKRRTRSGGRKAKAKPDAAEQAAPPPEREVPPSIDRADEADTPMHWLDEI